MAIDRLYFYTGAHNTPPCTQTIARRLIGGARSLLLNAIDVDVFDSAGTHIGERTAAVASNLPDDATVFEPNARTLTITNAVRVSIYTSLTTGTDAYACMPADDRAVTLSGTIALTMSLSDDDTATYALEAITLTPEDKSNPKFQGLTYRLKRSTYILSPDRNI